MRIVALLPEPFVSVFDNDISYTCTECTHHLMKKEYIGVMLKISGIDSECNHTWAIWVRPSLSPLLWQTLPNKVPVQAVTG